MSAPRSLFRIACMAALLVCAAAGLGLAAGLVRDASGRAVNVVDTKRIVSVGGAVTEILYALGLEKQIVAVDTTSVFPPDALKEKPNVGYMRQLSPEGVLGLAPSVVIAAAAAGPPEAIAVIEASSIPLIRVPDRFTGEGIVEKVGLIATATGKSARGDCLIKAVEADLSNLGRLRGRVEKPVRVLFVLSFMNERPMVAGRETAADGVIRLAGAVNAIDEFDGYKVVNEEAIVAAKPDFVLVMQRPDLALTEAEVFARPGFSATPAASRKAFVAMEASLLGFGPRTAQAARDLSLKLYPSLRDAGAAEKKVSYECP